MPVTIVVLHKKKPGLGYFSHMIDRTIKICTQNKSSLMMFSNGWALSMAIAIVPTIRNPDIFERISNGVWQNGGQISNGWASGFQIPLKIWSINNPTSFWPFKIHTIPDFRSPLYWTPQRSGIQIITVFWKYDFSPKLFTLTRRTYVRKSTTDLRLF